MTEPAHLLPPNATSAERALSQATARDVGPAVRDLWNPDTCPAAVLPWLAWALSVDSWDSGWSEETKRAVIAESVRLHRKKGTPWSIRYALETMGYKNVEIVEGGDVIRTYNGRFKYDGTINYNSNNEWEWAEFEIILNAELNEDVTEIVAKIENHKPERSKLRQLTTYQLTYNGAAYYDDTYQFDGGVVYG